MSDLWYWMDSGKAAPEWNMAADEALLQMAVRVGAPVLRAYGWERTAATFGYFQDFGQVSGWTDVRPLVRRPTAGGLVLHDSGEWTYSLVFPPGHPGYRVRPVDSYRRLHGWIQAALDACGTRVELAPERDPSGPGICFVGAEPCDLVQGRLKVAGAAQRRNRQGFLIQGSIRHQPGWPDRATFLDALRRVLVGEWGGVPEPFPMEPDWRSLSDDCWKQRYGQPGFHERRH
jgi:lipoate-protein ligase A